MNLRILLSLVLVMSLSLQAMSDIDAQLFMAAHPGGSEAMEQAFAAGADPNAQEDTGRTPLMIAIMYDHPELIALLLAHGADVNVKDEIWGFTALNYAIMQNLNEKFIDMLLAHGADVNIRNNEGETILHWATHNAYSNPKLIQKLYDAQHPTE